jgi:porin
VVICDLALFTLSADGSPFVYEGPLVVEGPFATDALTNGLPPSGEPPRRDFAFSDFFASRDTDCGIRIDPIYWGECFTNARGGIATAGATQYLGLLDLWLTIDFERLRIPVWGNFQILAENSHGRGLTQDFVGDSMVLSNIDPLGNITQVGEYWWEVGVLDEAVTFRLGKQDVNREFYFLDAAGEFVQSGFTLSPNAYLPSYPHQTMAAVALVQLEPSLQLKVGVWDTLADRGSWGFSSQDTVLVTGELEYAYTLLDASLPGRITVGALYLTASEFLGEESGGGHGYELQFEQTIFRERDSDTEDPQGLQVFAAFYPQFQADPVLVDEIGDSFAAGMVYTGLLPGRDQDAIGAGFVSAELFQGGTNRETAVEVFYWAVVTDRVCIQPDLQYIVTPSGIYPDALVAGVRLQVDW